jgi:putative ABC transport system permease protein
MASRTYAVLLRCFPRDFRERHAAGMAAHFDEQYRLTASRPMARALLWVRVVGDALRHGWALRLGSDRSPGRVSPVPADVRQAWRSLRAQPAHALTCVALLAVTLAVSTAVFTIVDAVILRPLPFPDPAALVEIFYLPADLARVWQAQTSLFSSAGTVLQGGEAVIGGGETTRQRVALAYTTPALFPVLGIRPIVGRTFSEDEAQPGRDRLIVISESIWQARFNRDPAAIGQTLLVNDLPETIIGVMPRSFAFPFSGVKVWLPYDLAHPPTDHFAEVIGRSRFGGNYEVLGDRVAALAPGIMPASVKPSDYPSVRGLEDLRVMPAQTRQSILVLAGATLLLLLTAAANLSTLTLTQILTRTRQTAIQSALGASRTRLVRQALIEQFILGIGALGLAVPLTLAAVLAVQRLGPDVLTVWTLHVVALDARGVGVLGVLALATPVLTGLVPAWAGSRRSVADLLKQDTRASVGSRASRALRHLLVTMEIVCAVVLLLAGALLVLASFGWKPSPGGSRRRKSSMLR